MERTSVEKGIPILFLVKCLLCSYIVTALLIFVLTLMLYALGLGENVVSVGIIVIYVAATFVGGFIAGKKLKNRKFLWGLLVGAAYFGILVIVSLLVNQSAADLGDSFATTLTLCAAGGMLGGMLS